METKKVKCVKVELLSETTSKGESKHDWAEFVAPDWDIATEGNKEYQKWYDAYADENGPLVLDVESDDRWLNSDIVFLADRFSCGVADSLWKLCREALVKAINEVFTSGIVRDFVLATDKYTAKIRITPYERIPEPTAKSLAKFGPWADYIKSLVDAANK